MGVAIRKVTGREPHCALPAAIPNSRHLYVHAPILARAVQALGLGGAAHEKRLPDLLLNCAEHHQLAFLEGYFLGDGTKDRRGRVMVFATSSADLANGLLYLLGQLGVLAGLAFLLLRSTTSQLTDPIAKAATLSSAAPGYRLHMTIEMTSSSLSEIPCSCARS